MFFKGRDHGSAFNLQPNMLFTGYFADSPQHQEARIQSTLRSMFGLFFQVFSPALKGHLTITEKTLESAAIRRHLKRDPTGNLQRKWRCGNEKNI